MLQINKCCNPLNKKGHKNVKKKLVRITANRASDFKDFVGYFMCNPCVKKMYRGCKPAIAENSYEEPLKNNSIIDVSDTEISEIQVDDRKDPIFKCDTVDNKLRIDNFNKVLLEIGEPPVKWRRISSVSECKRAVVKSLRKLRPTDIIYKNVPNEPLLSNFKSAFNKANTRSEKIQVLTTLPLDWPIKMIKREFKVSKKMVKVAKNSRQRSGFASKPETKKGKRLDNSTVDRVKSFYLSDDFSRVMPGIKDYVTVLENGKKLQKQKRLLLFNICDLYKKFKEAFPNEKIGQTRFQTLRPRECISAGKSGTHNVCVCKIHQNIKLQLQGLQSELRKKDIGFSESLNDLIQSSVCVTPTLSCFFSTCKKCSENNGAIEKLKPLLDRHEIEEISFSQWKSTDSEERPKRSYSIGSKIDKSKIKRLGNSNDILQDTNAVRVRAFSVGSRAKIPKCGLQRSVLFPKSYLNQSCISNNSLNSGTDDTGHKFELNTSCNKKSTSAPILIQNGQVPIDSMSDLMEIDFSKSSNHKAHKSGPVNGKNPGLCLNEFKSNITSPLLKSIGHDESGYLEMKPVECTIGASKKLLPARDPYNKGNENEGMKLNPKHFDGDKSDHASYSENIVGLSSVYSSLAKQTCSEMHADSNQNCAICDADKRNKAIGNMSWETNNLKNVLSDSQTEKEQNIYFSEKVDNLRSPDISQLEYELSSKACSSANKNKHSFSGNSIADNKTVQTSKSTCSPSSSSCYELYYAKLELPQCNSKDNRRLEKPNISSKNTENDSYAKIDFEHSSDSSSSSKILTN